MPADSSTRTTRLSGDLDDRYETFRDSNDMTDAEALRTLIREGLDGGEQNPIRLRHIAQVAVYAGVLGALTLFVATGVLAGLVAIDAALGVPPLYTGLAGIVAALVSGIGYLFVVTGWADRFDAVLARLDERLGVDP